MDSAQIVALLSATAAELTEDMALMKAGVVRCQCLGEDVTQENVERMGTRLAKIEAVIRAHRCEGP